MSEWEKHDDLQHDLATTRRAAGDIAVEKLGIGSFASGGQIDVFAIKPSHTRTTLTAYEVKVSRSDFLSDMRAEKFRRYLAFCGRLYFATPAGMVDKKEVPEGMGLCVRGPNGWHTVMAPRVRTVKPEDQAVIVLSSLLKVIGGPWARPTRHERIRRMAEVKEVTEWTRELPARIREALAGAEVAKRQVARARADLFHALNVPDDGRDLHMLAAAVLTMAPRQAHPIGHVRNQVQALVRSAQRVDELLAGLNGDH